jgi:hypothetical protein
MSTTRFEKFVHRFYGGPTVSAAMEVLEQIERLTYRFEFWSAGFFLWTFPESQKQAI